MIVVGVLPEGSIWSPDTRCKGPPGEGASVMEEGVAARVRRHGRGGWRREREGVGRERGER